MSLQQKPALGAEGWFTEDGPALLGNKCTSCATIAFPPTAFACPNPACEGAEFISVPLSNKGKVWAATDAQYKPPPPYISPTAEHVPFALAAVELDAEKLVVMGQVFGVDAMDLPVGTPMRLAVGTLFSDDEFEYRMWRWEVEA